MFTSIIKGLSGTKMAECNEIIYVKHQTDDEYKRSNVAF